MSTLKFKRFVFCSVVVAIAFVLSGCRSAPVVSLAQGTPGETVESFYRWYIDYPGNVLVDGAYRSSEYLTEELVQQVDEIIASFDKGGYDPFLCAQDVPGNLAFDQAVVSGEDASVVVHEIWNPGTPYETRTEVTVALQMVDGKWKIADIICPASQVAATPEQVVESFYNWYLSYIQNTGNVLADGAYQSSEHLTEGFVENVDKLLTSFDKGGYDPFLCAQDVPQNIAVGEATVSGETAEVQVTEVWNAGTKHELVRYIMVELQLVDGRWLIADIGCLEPDPLVPTSESPKAMTPEAAVKGFYDWYLTSCARDEGAGDWISPLSDGRYRSSEYLTEEFVREVDETIASFDKRGYDPFLCAQDVPQSFIIKDTVVSGDAAQVIVRTSFEGHRFTVTLKRTGEIWKIDGVLCEGNETNSVQIEDWESFVDEQYGFRLRFPKEWGYEESPPMPPGEVPDGMKALKRVLFFQPQGWDGVAPPLHIQVTEGTEEEFEWLYAPAAATENIRINDSDVIKAIEDGGGIQVIRYIFPSPNDESVRVVAIDYISGFPDRAEGNDDVVHILQQILHTVEFIK
jgi:hypothetical protein